MREQELLLTTGFAKLNAVMAANPIGIVVTVLAALVAAAIYAYTQFDWFRQVVDGAWNGIKAAAQAAWEGVIRPVFEAIGGWITGSLALVAERDRIVTIVDPEQANGPAANVQRVCVDDAHLP
mgnify:CR=1 FL=1